MSQPKGVSDHPAKELMEQIWRDGGKAKDIALILEEQGYPPIQQSTIARYGQRYWTEKVRIQSDSASPADLKNVLDEIESSGLGTVTKIGYSKKQYANGNEGISQTIEVKPSQATPTLERAEIGKFKINIRSAKRQPKLSDVRLALVLPDMQIGYHRNMDGSLTTCHDEAAIDVAHQIIGELDLEYGIDLVVNLGDNLDLPGFSSHRSAPGFMGPDMTKLAIDRYGTELAMQRALAPDATIVAFNGNHENRLNNTIVDKMPALHGISRAGDTDPVLSIGYLCKYDEYDITGIDTYPDGVYWANDHLRFLHGSAASSALGATAAKHLGSAKVSSVYGHIHRQELLYATVQDAHSARDIFAGSPGCLARIDGVLPSGQTGISSKGGQAGIKRERWQHGMFIIWYEPDGEQLAWCQPISILNGNAVLNGKRFTASVNPNGEKIDA
jgi:hypothetical protein